MRKLSMDELNRKSVAEFKSTEKIPVIVLLENIRSAYNVGSVFRTADAFLIEAVFISGYTAKPPHKEITKTALGAQDAVDWKYFENTKLAIEQLRQNQYRVFAVEQVADSISLDKLSELDIDKIAFIFGNEVSGVDHQTLALCD